MKQTITIFKIIAPIVLSLIDYLPFTETDSCSSYFLIATSGKIVLS